MIVFFFSCLNSSQSTRFSSWQQLPIEFSFQIIRNPGNSLTIKNVVALSHNFGHDNESRVLWSNIEYGTRWKTCVFSDLRPLELYILIQADTIVISFTQKSKPLNIKSSPLVLGNLTQLSLSFWLKLTIKWLLLFFFLKVYTLIHLLSLKVELIL